MASRRRAQFSNWSYPFSCTGRRQVYSCLGLTEHYRQGSISRSSLLRRYSGLGRKRCLLCLGLRRLAEPLKASDGHRMLISHLITVYMGDVVSPKQTQANPTPSARSSTSSPRRHGHLSHTARHELRAYVSRSHNRPVELCLIARRHFFAAAPPPGLEVYLTPFKHHSSKSYLVRGDVAHLCLPSHSVGWTSL